MVVVPACLERRVWRVDRVVVVIGAARRRAVMRERRPGLRARVVVVTGATRRRLRNRGMLTIERVGGVLEMCRSTVRGDDGVCTVLIR